MDSIRIGWIYSYGYKTVVEGFVGANQMLTTLILTIMMPQQQQTADSLNDSDQAFLRKAAQINIAEVRSSKLVMNKTTDDTIRNACQMMIDDHTKAMDQLKTVAKTYQYNLPVNPSDSAKADWARLDEDGTMDIDKDFVAVQFEGHRKAIRLFRDEMKNGSATGVKNFDSTTLPTLKTHYQMWRGLALKYGVISADYKDDDGTLTVEKDAVGGR